MAKISKEELKGVLHSFSKDNSPGPYGLPIEFFLGCFEFLGDDLLRVVEYSRTLGQILAPFNTTFIALISKSNNSTSFEAFKPISICNTIYKIISKIIALWIKNILSTHISLEQFGFFNKWQIHDAIGLAHEGLHSIHTRNHKVVVFKVDHSKDFDRVSWLYIRLLLIHLGFYHQFVSWVMNCISSSSFAILLNGATNPFFHAGRGLRQGCPLSPLIFLVGGRGTW
jgi:hypothetical protein